jgi:hypothetical protein
LDRYDQAKLFREEQEKKLRDMVRGNNWQPTCRLIKPLPESTESPSEIADIEIENHGKE